MIMNRVAGAPISWGVCEVPGWGYQLAPEQVLPEMKDIGLVATEFGPDGFLPRDPAAKAETLRELGLSAVGGFVPVVLHQADHDPLREVDRELDGFVAAGAGTIVLAAVSGLDGYDTRPELDERAWQTLFANLDRVADRARERGVAAALHPHVGTMVENREEVDRVLAGSTVPLCLDTGHLLIGGTDPVELAKAVPERISHTHLKDVDLSVADRVKAGEIAYTDGVRNGLYRPLGAGDIDIAAIVDVLESHGYQGWYTMEQDTILTGKPEGEGPAADVRASVAYLRSLDR
ncbi:sugar phosphate isomerase/epimerase family protein [Amycolatopsis echigonensis]|uniref:TIM barrel protein n=1 Tax=Amycolatopsis echigonensis TaxID=2576905 RepID=A0A8E1W7F3_9PSEU|nr:sugar phosphate isomerase/epimerase [Amycolatopsis echigonensis]MBB2504890.1 TIM barrel protein [Amycolatopsis echigonensis]